MEYYIVEVCGLTGTWMPICERNMSVARFGNLVAAQHEARMAVRKIGRDARIVKVIHEIIEEVSAPNKHFQPTPSATPRRG